jgi:hypothetical protein
MPICTIDSIVICQTHAKDLRRSPLKMQPDLSDTQTIQTKLSNTSCITWFRLSRTKHTYIPHSVFNKSSSYKSPYFKMWGNQAKSQRSTNFTNYNIVNIRSYTNGTFISYFCTSKRVQNCQINGILISYFWTFKESSKLSITKLIVKNMWKYI